MRALPSVPSGSRARRNKIFLTLLGSMLMIHFGFGTICCDFAQKLANMEDEVRQRGFRSNAERGVMQHDAWGDLMKLLRQTAGNTAGLRTKHPKLVGGSLVVRLRADVGS